MVYVAFTMVVKDSYLIVSLTSLEIHSLQTIFILIVFIFSVPCIQNLAWVKWLNMHMLEGKWIKNGYYRKFACIWLRLFRQMENIPNCRRVKNMRVNAIRTSITIKLVLKYTSKLVFVFENLILIRGLTKFLKSVYADRVVNGVD